MIVKILTNQYSNYGLLQNSTYEAEKISKNIVEVKINTLSFLLAVNDECEIIF